MIERPGVPPLPEDESLAVEMRKLDEQIARAEKELMDLREEQATPPDSARLTEIGLLIPKKMNEIAGYKMAKGDLVKKR